MENETWWLFHHTVSHRLKLCNTNAFTHKTRLISLIIDPSCLRSSAISETYKLIFYSGTSEGQ